MDHHAYIRTAPDSGRLTKRDQVKQHCPRTQGCICSPGATPRVPPSGAAGDPSPPGGHPRGHRRGHIRKLNAPLCHNVQQWCFADKKIDKCFWLLHKAPQHEQNDLAHDRTGAGQQDVMRCATIHEGECTSNQGRSIGWRQAQMAFLHAPACMAPAWSACALAGASALSHGCPHLHLCSCS